MPDVWRGNKKCGTACGYCFAIPAGTSEHTSKRTIHLRYLLVQVVREHQPADHTHDTATQTDDEHFPSPGTVSEIISRTVQEQIATLANLLRSTQEQSEAMAERCRTLEERQSQVQLQDVRFSSAPPASDRVRFVNAVAYRVRKLLLQHRRRTAQWEPELSWITRLTQQERKAQIIERPIWWAKRCDEKLDGVSWRLKSLDKDRLVSHFAFMIYFLRSYSFSGVLLHVAPFLASFDRATCSPATWCWTFRMAMGKIHTYIYIYIYNYIYMYYMIYL
jgi:hypothetical protein